MKHLTDTEKWELLIAANDAKAKGNAPVETEATQDLGVAYLCETVLQLASDSAADLLRSLPADFSAKVLEALPESRRFDLKELLSYKADTAGAIMAKEYLAIPAHLKIHEAIDLLQKVPNERKGRAPYVYIVDNVSRPKGVVSTKDLIFNSPDVAIDSIATHPALTVNVQTPQKDVARFMREHNHLAVPVVDASGELAGIISANSLLQAMKDQADREIAKMVGTDAEEMTARSPFRILRLRLPWLLFSIASGLFCAFISDIFQRHLAEITALFLFVPVVLGLSESTGIQGATIVVRNLSVRDLAFKELWKLMRREMMVGIMIGVVCGFIVGVITSFWQGNPVLGIAIAASMNVAILVSAIIGLLLPIIFKAFKLDPAVASGPLVLALCDIQTLGVYFFLAGWILQNIK